MTRKKTTKDLIDLTVVVDRSGSMAEMREEAQAGLNEFFKKQREAAPNTRVTLVQFDTEYEFVHEDVAISEVPEYSLIPRGMTALLDAAGKAAAEAIERIKSKGKEISKKIFVVITDGHENSSHEWTKAKVKGMIEELKSEACEIVFLGANIDSFAEGGSLGVPVASTANYAPTAQGMKATMHALLNNAVSYSTGRSHSMAYSALQRTNMGGGVSPSVTRPAIRQFKKDSGMSWASLERAAGLGNSTLKRYANGETTSLSESTVDRLRNTFPGLS